MDRKIIAVVICTVGLMMTLASTVQAQNLGEDESPIPSVEATGDEDVAVIVAVEEYVLLPNVPGAVENGLEWKAFFRQGLDVESVYFLSDTEAAHEEIERMAKAAASEVGEEGTLWFVFIGHGAPAQQEGEAALVGMDARQSVEGIQSRSVSRTDLLAALQSGEQKQTVMILDACFSGRSSDGESLAPGTQPVVPVSAVPDVASSTVILSAASADQYAGRLVDKERPAFSYLLLDGIRTLAGDEDGVVTAELALSHARQELRRIPGRTQIPEVVGAGDLELARGLADAVSESKETSQERSSSRETDQEPKSKSEGEHRERRREAMLEAATQISEGEGERDDASTDGQSTGTTSSKSEPKLEKISLDEQSAFELMRGVCGDGATLERSGGGRVSASCPGACPSKLSNPDGAVALSSAYVGDFSGDGRQDAILGMSAGGCGTSEATGHLGAYFLGLSTQGRYQHGVELRECELLRFSDKDRLLCLPSHAGQGAAWMQLQLHSVKDGKISTKELTEGDELYDNAGGCYYRDGRFDAYATTQIVEDLSGNGEDEIAIGITERRGQPVRHIDTMDFDARCDEDNYAINKVRKLRIWTLDDGEFRRAPQLERDVSHPELHEYQ